MAKKTRKNAVTSPYERDIKQGPYKKWRGKGPEGRRKLDENVKEYNQALSDLHMEIVGTRDGSFSDYQILCKRLVGKNSVPSEVLKHLNAANMALLAHDKKMERMVKKKYRDLIE